MPQLDLGKVVGDTGPQGLPGSPGEKGETGDTGPGVAAGGATNQVLVKHSGTNYDTEWVNAGDLPSNVAMQDAMAIVANGDSHAAIASGQFVYVRNHSSLAEGLYKATAAIATNGALSTSNLTADVSGGMNALKADIDTLNSNIVNLVSSQSFPISNADGTNKEIQLTLTLRSGYRPYIFAMGASHFDWSHYVAFWSQPSETTGQFYCEHNLVSSAVSVTAYVMWIPIS